MAVHAATTKKAEAHGLVIVEAPGRVEVRRGAQVIAHNGKASTALKHALEVIEGDRIRNLSDNREPVLIVAGRLPPPEERPQALPKLIKGSIIKPKYREQYKKNGDYSCGDDIASELRAYIAEVKDGKLRVNLTKLKEVAVANSVWKDSYDGLNPGQRRMTIGNRIRHKYLQGEQVDIGGAIWEKHIEV